MSQPESEVYTATYSGIQVFEMTVNDLSMMRRRSDSYLNATQILKLGGLEKGKRTKILEREILPSTHEKIQGGYGKYQGTWVPFERGRELAERYNVLELMLPLLDFDTSIWDQLPEKEQLTTRPRNRNTYNYTVLQPRASPPSSPSYSSQQDSFGATSLYKRKLLLGDNDENGSTPLPPSATPKKRPKGNLNKAITPSSARATIISKKDEMTDGDVERQVNTMLSIFSSGEDDHIPPSLYGAGAIASLDMDISLDDHGHTALHWSVALARIHTVEWLISKGATVTMVNYVGETALMRGVMATCIYDNECFPQMLDILRSSISLVDHVGRSVLHHIILSSLESKTTSNSFTEGPTASPQPSTSSSTTATATTAAAATTATATTPSASHILSSPLTTSSKTLSTLTPCVSSPSSSSVLPPTPSSQSENRQLAAKSYMQNVLRTIHQHREHLIILNKPDDSGETPYALASRLNCTDLCYMLAQSGCNVPNQDATHFNNTVLALPQPLPRPDLSHKKPKKRNDKKVDRKVSYSGDPTNPASGKGQELISTVQRFVDAMDLEFNNKLQIKEADLLRMQQENKDLSQQLDEGRKQWEEDKKTSADQLQQAQTRIKQLEDRLGRSGVKELEIGSDTGQSSPTEREKQMEQQIIKLQSEAQLASKSYTDLQAKEMGCKRLIAACCNLPLDKVDDFIEPLTLAVENDPPDMDFARVIGFMEKLRQHQQ